LHVLKEIFGNGLDPTHPIWKILLTNPRMYPTCLSTLVYSPIEMQSWIHIQCRLSLLFTLPITTSLHFISLF